MAEVALGGGPTPNLRINVTPEMPRLLPLPSTTPSLNKPEPKITESKVDELKITEPKIDEPKTTKPSTPDVLPTPQPSTPTPTQPQSSDMMPLSPKAAQPSLTEQIQPLIPLQPAQPMQLGPVEPKTYNEYQKEIITSTTSDNIKDEEQKKEVGIIDSDFYLYDNFLRGKTKDGELRIKTVEGGTAGSAYALQTHGTIVLGIFATNNSDSKIKLEAVSAGGGNLAVGNDHFDRLYKSGVRVFNNSYGNVRETEEGADMQSLVGDKPEKDSIFVWAAGNEGGKDKTSGYASPQSLYPTIKDAARNGWIAVAATEKDNENKLASYSSKIGEKAKNWGITAKGNHSVKFSARTVTYFTGGTSFAAPVVTAAVANVWNKFPWMSNHLVTVSVLSTANKPGTQEQSEAPDANFGWGVLNQTRALNGPGRFDTKLLTNKDHENKLLTVDFEYRDYKDKSKLTWSNNIAGDAGILKKGTGTLYLSGDNTYTGDTKIQNGVLSFSGSLANSKVIIEQGGTFEARNDDKKVQVVKVGNQNSYTFTNNGSLNIYGKGLKIDGDYTAGKDSRIVIDIDKSNLEVTGTMNMNDSRIVADIQKVEEVPNSTENTKTIITANSIQNYNGKYNISDKISSLISIKELRADDKQISVVYKRESVTKALQTFQALSASTINTSENVEKVLENISRNPSSHLKAAALSFFAMSAPVLNKTIKSLSGEIHSSSLNTLVLSNKIFNRTASDRVYSSMISESSGFWMDGIYADTKLSQNGYSSADVDTKGSQMGLDYKPSENTTLGLSLNQSVTKTKFDRYSGSNEIKSTGVSLYGGYEFDDRFYIASRLGYAFYKNEVDREIINTSSKVKYNASSYALYTEIGKNFSLNDVSANVYVANEINHIKRDGFSEKEDFGITSSDKKYTSNAFLIGARTSINSGNFSFMANINHSYTPKPKNFDFMANYTNDDTPIYIKGMSELRHLTYVGMGMSYEVYKNLTLSLKADKSLSKNRAKSSLMRFGFRFKF
ncbi:autotransporter domain-containing protein [Campylobacter majalis]|uniref:autotransporter domain-containing protein n=1 Tax=Campylobacter majalis TaxID=2790656 RepID=UPI003D6911B5